MRLFFARHGQAEHNKQSVYNESNETVSELTQQGEDEALKTAKELAKEVEIDIIYCSPLERCYQTAKIIGSKQSKKTIVKKDERLSELKTGFNGRSYLVWFAHLFFSRNRLNKKFKNGQSIQEKAQMVQEFWDEIIQKHPQKNVLIVAHLYTFQLFCCYIYDKPLKVPWRRAKYLPTGDWCELHSISKK